MQIVKHDVLGVLSPRHFFALGLCWMLVLGCEPASSPPPVVTEPVQAHESKEPSTPVVDSKEPQTVAQHPLDELSEGKRYRAGTKALDANDLAKVRAIADELLQSKDYAPLGQVLEGFLLIRSGKLDDAMALAERLSEIPVLQSECYLIAGEVFTKRLQYLAALDAFTNAAKKDPSNVRAHRWLAVVHHDTGAMNKATEHLRIVASLDPTDLRSLRFAGMIHREYEKFEDSVTDYQNALKRNPPAKVADEIRLELAESLLKLRKLEEVQETLAGVASQSALRSALLAESL